jgi:hypothetical protein
LILQVVHILNLRSYRFPKGIRGAQRIDESSVSKAVNDQILVCTAEAGSKTGDVSSQQSLPVIMMDGDREEMYVLAGIDGLVGDRWVLDRGARRG